MTQTETHKSDNLLRAGQHLVLEFPNARTLCSRIYSVLTSEKRLKIAAPTSGGRIQPIATRSRFDVCFCEEIGGVLSRFRFSSELEGYRKESDILYSAVINYPDRLVLLERREFFRMRVALNGTLRLSSQDREVSFVTRDLSASGALILSQRYLPVGARLQAELSIGDQRPTEIQGQVVRITGKDLYGRWMIGVQFQQMDLQLERNLMKFMFQSHRKRLQELAKSG